MSLSFHLITSLLIYLFPAKVRAKQIESYANKSAKLYAKGGFYSVTTNIAYNQSEKHAGLNVSASQTI